MGIRLLATVPIERLSRYKELADLHSVDVYKFYRWNQLICLSLFDDISVVEVAMRSAMSRELVATFGINWFENETILDSQALKSIEAILERAKKTITDPQVLHGKLVASLTLGFWVKLLGRGDRLVVYSKITKKQISSTKRVYDDLLWKPALRNAFPHAKSLGRATVESLARDMQFARNRVAHHEHVIWGIPAVGQKDPKTNFDRRIPLLAFQSELFELARLIDNQLEQWLIDNSSLQNVINVCPLPVMTDLLI